MKSNSIKIRKFKASDAEDCFRIRAEAFVKLFYEEIGSDGVILGINSYMPDKFIELAELGPFFVAVDNQIPLGFIASRTVVLQRSYPVSRAAGRRYHCAGPDSRGHDR